MYNTSIKCLYETTEDYQSTLLSVLDATEDTLIEKVDEQYGILKSDKYIAAKVNALARDYQIPQDIAYPLLFNFENFPISHLILCKWYTTGELDGSAYELSGLSSMVMPQYCCGDVA